ncbi:MAG: hypothetical protein DCC88_01370 [Spirobacillus cienkowskii]|jgi:hypothetical protein|uniref:TonB C-terminal domain-containing protein n=1 Tax=Spirobacillus cienkowskii TaxID=495820 RepID=A0A369L128_9BACT|nr:MAG: hypothetical protein DCC88_01370 [Spirobacillus cienkowskii]
MVNYKKSKKKILSDNTFLFLQVFQMGALQLEKKFKINSLFSKKIRFGGKTKYDILIPYSRAFLKMGLFNIGRNRVDIVLDPRLEGFLSTGSKFGNFKEFTSPRGSLLQISTIDEPLIVPLDYGSRGKIQLNGFDIAFKIEKEQKIKEIKVQKIESKIFQMPEYDLPIERSVIPISMIATGIVFLPFLFWLLKAPMVADTGLIHLPSQVSIRFIAPENIRLLPFVYESKYDPNENEKLAIFWVYELLKRWEASEKGRNSQSIIPFLKNSHKYVDQTIQVESWEKSIYDNYRSLESYRISKFSPRYYSYLRPYPAMTSVISGIEGSSQYVTLLKRLEQLKNTDKAILEYLELEHIILKDLYEKEYKSRKNGIVDPPSTRQVLGPQPDKSFNIEYNNFKIAERIAEIAENSSYRNKILEKENYPIYYSNKMLYPKTTSVIWIAKDDLIIPSDFRRSKEKKADETIFNNLMYNAYYSNGIYKIPDLPPPKAIIDKKMVDFVIFNKTEEIRSCYNAALRKNPGLHGDLKISWTILESGKAKNIKILDSNMIDKNLINCIESRLMVWNFPKPKYGPVVVTYPFQFSVNKNK